MKIKENISFLTEAEAKALYSAYGYACVNSTGFRETVK